MNGYALENTQEADRLEKQSSTLAYSITDDLQCFDISFSNRDLCLDAGCGTGVLTREIALLAQHQNKKINITGIDTSPQLLREARKEVIQRHMSEYIHFYQHSINAARPINSILYHKVFCRYVLQHLPNKKLRIKAIKNLLNYTRPKGELYLIDSFGVLTHIDINNEWITKMANLLNQKSPIDLDVGLKLRGYLLDLGIAPKNIFLKTLPLTFQDFESRQKESLNWTQRLWHARPLIDTLLGVVQSKKFCQEFPKIFLDERTLALAQKVLIKVIKT